MRRITTGAALLFVAFAAAAAVSGCRDEEQHRVVFLNKGKYHGKSDTARNEKMTAELRDRVKTQSF